VERTRKESLEERSGEEERRHAVSEEITVTRRCLDPSVVPFPEGERSNGKTADFGP